jgi:hypothetical protein
MDAMITRNEISLHVLDQNGLDNYRINPIIAERFYTFDVNGEKYYISTQFSFGDMAKFVLGDITYDFSMPYGEHKDGYVWAYDDGYRIFGHAVNVNERFNTIMYNVIGNETYKDTNGITVENCPYRNR